MYHMNTRTNECTGNTMISWACFSYIYYLIGRGFLRSAGGTSSSPGMGPYERESYHRMSNAKDTERLTRASRETLLTILETLPGALFFLDDSGTIVYANASAQELTEATSEEIIGKTLAKTLWWSSSPVTHENLRS